MLVNYEPCVFSFNTINTKSTPADVSIRGVAVPLVVCLIQLERALSSGLLSL